MLLHIRLYFTNPLEYLSQMTKYLPQDVQVLTDAASPYAANVSLDELPDGGWIVTWQDTFDPGYGIHLQRFDANGSRIGEELNLGAMDEHNVTVLSDGGWLIEGEDKSEYPYTPAIWRFDANGTRVDLPEGSGTGFQTMISLSTGGWAWYPAQFFGRGLRTIPATIR
jgi:hypothetical protein